MRLSPMRKRRRSLLIVLIVFLFLTFTLFPGLVALFISPVASYFTKIGTEIYSITYWANKTRVISSDDLKELSRTLNQYVTDRVDYEKLKNENDELKQLLGFVGRTEYSYVPVEILAKSFENTASRFVVNGGSKQGIEVNDPVVATQGVLVGKVIKVSSNFSTIVSITDSDLVTAVSLVNEHQTIGIARGTNSGLLSLSFIPLNETVVINDIVVTSGLETSVPSGLIVGIVNAVEQDETSLFQSAVVEPLIDARLLSSVIILTHDAL